MKYFLKRTWAEINLDAVRHNYFEIKNRVKSGTKIMCVVKADAYGHGAQFLAKEYEELGADWFAVSNIDEALQLRSCAITKPILILGYTPVCMAGTLSENRISQAVLSEKYADQLSKAAAKCGAEVNVHIKLDSGMSRIGLTCQDQESDLRSVDVAEKIFNMPHLKVEGVFTHFAVADEAKDGEENTINQFNNFMNVVNGLKQKGINIPLVHCSNSGAIIDYPYMNLDMVRAGIVLYGLSPSEKLKDKLNLEPVMQLKSVVAQLKKVSGNTAVSYGRTFITKKETTIATVPIGYADGYSRSFSNTAEMIVCGRRVPVIGRVCMDQLMLDVTGVEGIEEGAVVTVFGSTKGEEICVDELARICGTINYELVCLVGKRVPRVYFKDGENIGQLNYIVNL